MSPPNCTCAHCANSCALPSTANDWAIDQSCLADYLREVRSLQADFRGRFSLYCGLEWDSCSPLPEQKLDYLIGSGATSA